MSRKSLKDNTTTLPELVVTPEPWQIDYKNNFANKDIRNLVREGIKDELAKYDYHIAIDKRNQYLQDLIKQRNNKNITTSDIHKLIKIYDDNFLVPIKNNIKYNEEKYKDKDVTLETKRLWEVWNEAGRPNVTSYKSFINYLTDGRRANSNPITNTLYNINSFDDLVAELSHPIQGKYGDIGILQRLGNVPETIWNEIRGKRKHYDNPNHYEYETHSVIEPEVYDYILKGIESDYLPKSKRKRSLED